MKHYQPVLSGYEYDEFDVAHPTYDQIEWDHAPTREEMKEAARQYHLQHPETPRPDWMAIA